jgi:hypothetical protein
VIKARRKGGRESRDLQMLFFMFLKKGVDFITASGRLVGCNTYYVIGKGIVNVCCRCGANIILR